MARAISGKSKDESAQSAQFSRSLIIFIGVIVRFVGFYYFDDFFRHSPQFATPNNSFQRFHEGVLLYEEGVDPYDGDMFHMMPMYVFIFRRLVAIPFFCMALWTFLDVAMSLIISDFVFHYACRIDNDHLTLATMLRSFTIFGYLLNPMTIGVCVARSFSALTNVFLAVFMRALLGDSLILVVTAAVLATSLNSYYVTLLAPILLHFSGGKVIGVVRPLAVVVLVGAGLFVGNLALVANPTTFIRSTVGFPFIAPDLTPNCGLFWYFFTQVFEHYHLLFLFSFQINAFIYVVPLTATLRKNAHLLAVVLLACVAITSSYPSYAETAVYLPLLLAFADVRKYVRYSLVVGATIVASIVLTPVMWRMWVVTGTGNANFFFAIVCVFNFAQVLLFCDVVSACLRAQMLRENSLVGKEHTIESIKFIDAALL